MGLLWMAAGMGRTISPLWGKPFIFVSYTTDDSYIHICTMLHGQFSGASSSQ